MFEILTPMQMRAAEEASVRLGTGLDVLMDNAGQGLQEEYFQYLRG